MGTIRHRVSVAQLKRQDHHLSFPQLVQIRRQATRARHHHTPTVTNDGHCRRYIPSVHLEPGALPQFAVPVLPLFDLEVVLLLRERFLEVRIPVVTRRK